MKYIEDPDIDLIVNHHHLSPEEAAEISAFIQQYKATHGKVPTALKVEFTDRKDLDLLIALFQRLNMKWTLLES